MGRPAHTSKMELSARVVNGLKAVNLFRKKLHLRFFEQAWLRHWTHHQLHLIFVFIIFVYLLLFVWSNWGWCLAILWEWSTFTRIVNGFKTVHYFRQKLHFRVILFILSRLLSVTFFCVLWITIFKFIFFYTTFSMKCI